MTSDTPNPENQADDRIAEAIARLIWAEAIRVPKWEDATAYDRDVMARRVAPQIIILYRGYLSDAGYVIVPKTAVDAALRREDAPI